MRNYYTDYTGFGLDAKRSSGDDERELTVASTSSNPSLLLLLPGTSLTPSKASLSFLSDSEQVPVGGLCSFTISRERRREKGETARNTIRYQSTQCTAKRALIAGQGGVRVRGTQAGELYKEGSGIYQGPHTEGSGGRVGG